ncbi:hypothetical protein EDD94_1104 [Streptomyces sp. PanSC9]|nr:hypothetical protein EDD94_1104 [Streptomyces sp. PanSC9]
MNAPARRRVDPARATGRTARFRRPAIPLHRPRRGSPSPTAPAAPTASPHRTPVPPPAAHLSPRAIRAHRSPR